MVMYRFIVLLVVLARVCGPLLAQMAWAAPAISAADVQRAIERFEPILVATIRETGVPGVAVGVVYDDRLFWYAGYGVREVGKPDPVDIHTVFQLASVSKPIGATLIARLVGEGRVAWNDSVVKYLPDFTLSDPWVTDNITLADLYAHRSGLPDHAGDDLEEIGYDRRQIIERLGLFELGSFRSDYAYTNYGLTAAAEAAAAAVGMTWEDASEELLYRPLGMTSTTSRFRDYIRASNRAVPHVRFPDSRWVAAFQQQPDPESPAGGVASNIVDLARWMRLQLNGGMLEGRQLIDRDALAATHTPHIVTRPPVDYTARANHYGLGWFIDVDDFGQVRWWHSGSFARGAATTVNLVPAHGLGIVILTNGFPIGLPEAMAETFFDLVFLGEPSRDWFVLYNEAFEQALYPVPDIDYRVPPPDATTPRPLTDYIGTYENAYYGRADVVEGADDALVLIMGPARRAFPLGHYSGDTFWYMPPGEFGVVPGTVTFIFDGAGGTQFTLHGFSPNGYDHGPFVRRAPEDG